MINFSVNRKFIVFRNVGDSNLAIQEVARKCDLNSLYCFRKYRSKESRLVSECWMELLTNVRKMHRVCLTVHSTYAFLFVSRVEYKCYR